ncbi:MAG: DUF1622 domain-containing protein [Verrucomicrobiota bacterium]|nr:DUF1622 domain-containing protein [Verrucomicrobiota bacterium]
MIPPPEGTFIEPLILNVVGWLRLLVETCGAMIISVGVIRALRLLLKRRTSGFNSVRLELATYLVVALEFQLAADILSTAIAPSWDKIGKLGAIAVIRTTLNFFLMREIEIEKRIAGEHPLKQ